MASINDLATAAMASDTPSDVKRGAFIVLEGLDRSGKTTQVKLLEQRDQIKSLVAAGTIVISDRFYHSGIVYSAAKLNPSLPLSWARAPERGLPRPDLVLFLDLDEETARARGGWGGELYEKAEMQRRVRELFWGLSMGGKDIQGQEMLAELGGLDGAQWRQEEEDLVVVDAAGSVEEVADRIWATVEGRVAQVERGEVGRTVRIVQ
ncbi:thymidylate kinase [Metarhizium acridum CQMa 102]|uniref:dTMP kinase n=1 Tax=Metarhizium acridum (strain CQMa 102) TaxID=655827 RepID=E9EAA4_METAQ|nr:thymidylate kinase [Metarhizium acridum CQMa 102]EFY87125.1 thymidylate kinase [Metarhizium acridum CQMa 102]